MNKRHYEHTLPNIRGSLSNTYEGSLVWMSSGNYTFIGPTKAKISLVWLITKKRGRK